MLTNIETLILILPNQWLWLTISVFKISHRPLHPTAIYQIVMHTLNLLNSLCLSKMLLILCLCNIYFSRPNVYFKIYWKHWTMLGQPAPVWNFRHSICFGFFARLVLPLLLASPSLLARNMDNKGYEQVSFYILRLKEAKTIVPNPTKDESNTNAEY